MLDSSGVRVCAEPFTVAALGALDSFGCGDDFGALIGVYGGARAIGP